MKIRKRKRPIRAASQLLEVDIKELANVLEVLKDLGTGSRLQFLVAPRQSLSGLAPLQALSAGRYGKVLDLAAAFAEVPSEYVSKALAGLPRRVISKSLTRLSRVSLELLETARELHHHGLMSDAALSQAVLLAHTKPLSHAAVQAIISKHNPGAIENADPFPDELPAARELAKQAVESKKS